MSSDLTVRNSDAEEVIRLRREIAGLEQELEQAKLEAKQSKQALTDSVHLVRSFRKLFDPWHTFIGMLYGEISRVDSEEIPSSNGAPSSDAKWAGWKQRLGGKGAEIIDLLLLNNEMTITQVSKAAHCHYDTASKLLSNMTGQGVLARNGKLYSLKR